MSDADLTVGLEGADAVKSALNDIATTGANAFQQLASSVETGNFAGLAELIGGQVVGALVAAAQAVFEFVDAQAKAVVQLNALAQASGSTLVQMQGLRDTLQASGFSGEQAMQAISRAVLKVQTETAGLTEKLRDQAIAEQSASERVVSSVTNVAAAKERLAELGTKQAQTAISDSDAQASAELNLAKAKQAQIDNLTGTPDKAANALLQQQSLSEAVTRAQHATDNANIKSAEDQSNAPIEAAKAQEAVTAANTDALKALTSLLDTQMKSLKDLSDAIDGKGPDVGKLDQAKPGDLLAAEGMRAAQNPQNAAGLPGLVEQLARDSAKLPEQLGAVLKDLFPGRNQAANAELEQRIKANQQTPENLLKTIGPALTDKDVEASTSFNDSVNTFKTAVEEFSQKAPSILATAAQGIFGKPGGGFASGGPVSGPGSSTSDSAGLFALSHGEFVMKAAAVSKYGVDMFHALNGMEFPGMAMGGLVRPVRMAHGGAVPASSTLNLTIGGEHFNGLRAPEHVAKKLHTYAINEQTAQTGKKPSWVS